MEENINGWRLEWRKGNGDNEVWRYYKYHKRGQDNIQIAKYRDQDDFDKAMGKKYDWHGKWYVNLWNPEKIKLFKTKSQALKFAKNYMRFH